MAAGGDHHRAGDLGQLVPRIVRRPGLELAMRAYRVAGLVGVGIGRTHGHEQGVLVGVGLGPGVAAAGVADRDQVASARLALQILDFVERKRGPARAARRGAGQDETLDAAGMPQRQLLGHHAAERDPDDQRLVPALVRHQRGGVVRIVGHGIWDVGLVRLPEPTLVVGQEVEALGQRPVEDVRLVAQVAAGAGDEQQGRARARALEVEVDAVHPSAGHYKLR